MIIVAGFVRSLRRWTRSVRDDVQSGEPKRTGPTGATCGWRADPVRFARPFEAQQAGISTIYQEVNLVPLMSVARNIFLGREPRNRFGLIDFARMHRETTRTAATASACASTRAAPCTPSASAPSRWSPWPGPSRSTPRSSSWTSRPPRSNRARCETLFRVIENLRGQGIAVLYVSHRMDELYRICDRVTVLRDGRHIHTGGPRRPRPDAARLDDARPRHGRGPPLRRHQLRRGGPRRGPHPGAHRDRPDPPPPAPRRVPVAVRPARCSASADCSAPAAARPPRPWPARCPWTRANSPSTAPP